MKRYQSIFKRETYIGSKIARQYLSNGDMYDDTLKKTLLSDESCDTILSKLYYVRHNTDIHDTKVGAGMKITDGAMAIRAYLGITTHESKAYTLINDVFIEKELIMSRSPLNLMDTAQDRVDYYSNANFSYALTRASEQLALAATTHTSDSIFTFPGAQISYVRLPTSLNKLLQIAEDFKYIDDDEVDNNLQNKVFINNLEHFFDTVTVMRLIKAKPNLASIYMPRMWANQLGLARNPDTTVHFVCNDDRWEETNLIEYGPTLVFFKCDDGIASFYKCHDRITEVKRYKKEKLVNVPNVMHISTRNVFDYNTQDGFLNGSRIDIQNGFTYTVTLFDPSVQHKVINALRNFYSAPKKYSGFDLAMRNLYSASDIQAWITGYSHAADQFFKLTQPGWEVKVNQNSCVVVKSDGNEVVLITYDNIANIKNIASEEAKIGRIAFAWQALCWNKTMGVPKVLRTGYKFTGMNIPILERTDNFEILLSTWGYSRGNRDWHNTMVTKIGKNEYFNWHPLGETAYKEVITDLNYNKLDKKSVIVDFEGMELNDKTTVFVSSGAYCVVNSNTIVALKASNFLIDWKLFNEKVPNYRQRNEAGFNPWTREHFNAFRLSISDTEFKNYIKFDEFLVELTSYGQNGYTLYSKGVSREIKIIYNFFVSMYKEDTERMAANNVTNKKLSPPTKERLEDGTKITYGKRSLIVKELNKRDLLSFDELRLKYHVFEEEEYNMISNALRSKRIPDRGHYPALEVFIFAKELNEMITNKGKEIRLYK